MRSGSSTCAARRRSGTPTSSRPASASTYGLPRETAATPELAPGGDAAAAARPRPLRGGGGAGQGAVPVRRPVRGRPRARVPRAVRVAVRVLRAAARAEPGAVRVPVQPRAAPGGGGRGEYLVGASPEMYVRVNGDRVETCPISGTIARGADPLEDAANIARLLGSAKEESELTMCTDVDRNDKSRVCVPGSVQVIGRRQIEMYSRLIHTVDHIEGRLRPGLRRARRVPHPHVGGDRDRRARRPGPCSSSRTARTPRGAGTAGRSARSASTAR